MFFCPVLNLTWVITAVKMHCRRCKTLNCALLRGPWRVTSRLGKCWWKFWCCGCKSKCFIWSGCVSEAVSMSERWQRYTTTSSSVSHVFVLLTSPLARVSTTTTRRKNFFFFFCSFVFTCFCSQYDLTWVRFNKLYCHITSTKKIFNWKRKNVILRSKIDTWLSIREQSIW